MTTREELRAKCIEVMDMAIDRAIPELAGILFEAGISADKWEAALASAFDSLHGVANVCPIEATDEMIEAGFAVSEDACALEHTFAPMSAAGRLTNPPEKKS